MDSVDRRSDLSLEDFWREYAIPEKPVVLTGVTKDWAAARWTPEILAQKAGDVKVQTVPTGANSERSSVQMTLAEYVEYLKAPDERKLYMINWVFERDRPELLDDYEIPVYFKEDWLRELADPPNLLWIFIGPADSGLFMHQDVGYTSAWNVQLTGSKAWKLWHPDEEENLYSGAVNAFAPDYDAFPKYSQAKALDITVKQGECIYVPPRWWHQTKNIEAGMALTANFVDRHNSETVINYLRERPDYKDVYRGLKRVARRKARATSI